MVRSVALVAALGLSGIGCSLGAVQPVQPGLANGVALGGSRTVDDRVSDVVSNGKDSCGRAGEGGSALRYRWPPCPNQELSRRDVTVIVRVRAVDAQDDAANAAWLRSSYLRWPCVGSGRRRALIAAAAAESSLGAPTSSAPIACSAPR